MAHGAITIDARKALQWKGESGALDRVRLKDAQAALVKLGQTRDSRRAAQSAGAKVGTLIALVEEAAAALLGARRRRLDEPSPSSVSRRPEQPTAA